MLNYIDSKLNIVTMYRLTLYYLLGLLIWASLLGFVGLLPYPPIAIVISVAYIGVFAWITNLVFTKVFAVPANVESIYISVLILAFIITPIRSFHDTNFYTLAAWAGILSMASKYILAIRRKHLFNPAAIAVVITSYVLGLSASWWVGTSWMSIPVLLGGLLLTRKIIRTNLITSFFLTSLIVILLTRGGTSLVTSFERFIFTSSTLFFAFVMLTEPLTTPPTKMLRIIYGAIVGFLAVPTVHLGSYYFTPEVALIIGNLFAYIVSPKERLMLRLKEIKEIGTNTYDFIFEGVKNFSFAPGEYMEWTLPDRQSDNRGNRRYFTLASAPTESTVRLGVKFYQPMSTFKQSLINLKPGEHIAASQRAGDFTLPKDKNKKLVFIAGGIGITPFRSMIKYLSDKGEKRDITLFYSNKTYEEISYAEVFDEAYQKLEIKTIYTLTDTHTIPSQWRGEKGIINADMIRKYVPDLRDITFYISGPRAMVTSFEKTLSQLGIKKSRITTDYFPGFV